MTAYPENKNKYTLIGITAILLLLFLCSLFGSSLMLKAFGLPGINATLLFISRMLYWFSLLLLWLYAIKVEKQPLLIWQDRTLKPSAYVLSVVLLFVVLIAGSIIIQVIYSFTSLNRTSTRLIEIMNLLKEHKLLMVFTALTAGVTEELIFRGYMQPRLEAVFKNPYPAIIISAVLFGLLHYGYGTAINVIVPVFIGLVFACYYWKYRNIKVLIVCHFLWDVISMFLLLKSRH